ncbi:hypothetical protein CP960_05730 [Malaciobacter halophilus]|uniref:Uncharacterized protein n=1 Tax=Malaciobacter halophilus TaxID=197482 RepID=A0A2N1J3C2_9BACT|nr:hypothetical protein [Malaciobacter halophilus]AXH09147.1 hypothetical protein AHALO_0762 [Malaciobacter halophilus]PKI81057.1 hypothetical protein CP960_05730 [Malaciobacter halophilus]
MKIEFILFLAIVFFCLVPFLFFSKRRAKMTVEELKKVEPKIKEHINISSLKLPSKIEKLDLAKNSEIVRKIYHTFEILNIKDLNENQLDKKEWHSWQISMLLNLYKNNRDFFIPNKKEIFHKTILNLDNKSLDSFIQTILLKYKANVDIKASKDLLSEDTIWTNKDISILFYFLTTYKQ